MAARRRVIEDLAGPPPEYAYQTAHNWEDDKRRDRHRHKIYDDGTMTFFW